jgi:hypothetical protein
VIFVVDSDGVRWAFTYFVADELGMSFETVGYP